MRLLPKSLFGRLTLVLLAGLTATVLLSAAVQLRDRGQILYQSIHNDLIERTVDIVQLLDAVTPAERTRLLPVLSSLQTRIGLAAAPNEAPTGEADSLGAELVVRQLAERLGPDHEIRVALAGFVMARPMPRHRGPGAGPGSGRRALMMHGAHAMASRFFIQVRLRDGACR